MTNDAEHFFHVLTSYFNVLYCEMCSKCFAQFLIELFVFWLF